MSESLPVKKRDSAQWRVNSARWLDEHRPHLMAMTGNKPASETLLRALSLENYFDAELEITHMEKALPDPTHEEFLSARKEVIATWGEANHRDMIEFFREGGYEARKAKLLFEFRSRAMREEKKESAKIVMHDEYGEELPEVLEVVEGVQRTKRRSGMRLAGMHRRHGTAAKESDDDDLADAVMYGSREAGSW